MNNTKTKIGKMLLTAIIVLTVGSETFAQSSTSTTNFLAGRFLGWGLTSGDLPFKTNNITRMTLQNVTGWLGIGTTVPQAQLDIFHQITTAGSETSFRIDADIFNAGSTAAKIRLQDFGSNGPYNIVIGEVDASPFANIPIIMSVKDQNFPLPLQITFKSTAAGASGERTAGYFTAPGPFDSHHALVVPQNGGNVGIGTDDPDALYIFHVVGNSLFDGDVTVNGAFSGSDQRYKTNVNTLQNSLQKITQLRGVSYEWDIAGNPDKNFTPGTKIGLIAQEVNDVFPETVKIDSNGYYSLDYGRLVPVLVEAIKEQQAQIIALQGGSSKSTGNNTAQSEVEKIKLTLPDAPVLGDAHPNPNSGYAEIPYYLPENVSNAKIIFIDMLGRTMQEKNIQTGYSILGIDTKDLPSGTYTYTMILNGKTLDIKTMLKTK